MRVRMITFHTPKNYGAVLQAYALHIFLKSICGDVKVIDYNTAKLRSTYPLIPKPSSIKDGVKVMISLINLPKVIKKYRKFDEFVKSRFDLTERYDSTDELYRNPPESDLYITGSDQVFNPNRCLEERKAFYLDFVSKEKTIAAYAASFGISNIPDEKRAEIANYLNRFDYLSSRESFGVRIIESVSDKGAAEVLDPVFLLNDTDWNSISEEYPGIPDKYLLYYRLLDSPSGDLAVQKIARVLGLEIVIITDSLFKRVKTPYVLRDVGPGQFLWLYSNSSFVATTAFHGTAFSLVFSKPFIFCDEDEVTKERSLNLLRKLELESRMMPCDINRLIEEEIDYDSVGVKLNDLIENSKGFLHTVLESR